MEINKVTIASAFVMAAWSGTVQAAPDTEGQWSSQISWPLIAIHAVMTPSGDVFTSVG